MSKRLHGAPVSLCCLLVAGCMGDIGVSSTISEIDEVYCYGDPDTSMVCTDKSEVWTCESMPNGDEKCVHTPDGQPGWTCTVTDGKLVCTKSGSTGGGAGWECSYENGVTTCTSVGSVGGDGSLGGFSPPGGGDFTCTPSEFGVVCEGTPAMPPAEGGSGSTSVPPGTPPDTPPADGGKLPKPGEFRTQTPGGWGAPAAGNNPGAYRDKHFAAAFPSGLVIGCTDGHTAHFTSAKAIENYIPAGGTPGVLDKDYVDPLTTSAGVLGGHLVAATLAVVFDGYDPNFGSSATSVKHLVATSGVCKGMTVKQILQVGNAVAGGCSTLATPSEITSCLDAFNNNFVDGVKANGYLAYP